jgi:ribosome-interacting GTPase 1
MLPFEDIAFQLVDLPPITAERIDPWLPGVLQSADAAWLVVDIADADCTEQVLATCSALAQRKVTLSERWPGLGAQNDAVLASSASLEEGRETAVEEIDDPFRVHLPALLVANKCDLDPDPDEVGVLEELADVHFPAIATSAISGHGLDRLAPFVFAALGIVRVYTKLPGHPTDKRRPFTVRRGGTVLDVARLVHQDVARTLKYARLWGSSAFDGQQVGAEHRVNDGDVVELHAK